MKEKHSKVSRIQYDSLETQSYLVDAKFTLRNKQLLFKLRGKMSDVKNNFKNMYFANLQCNFCGECDLQTQDHLLVCPTIVSNCQDLYDNIKIEHDDIYGNLEEQLAVTKLYQKVFDTIEAIISV